MSVTIESEVTCLDAYGSPMGNEINYEDVGDTTSYYDLSRDFSLPPVMPARDSRLVLVRRLVEIRQRIVASGTRLLSIDEINDELSSGRRHG